MRHHCPTCTCATKTPESTLIEWVKDGVKAEGMNYFCEPRCQSCSGGLDRCPRDPYCKRYVTAKER